MAANLSFTRWIRRRRSRGVGGAASPLEMQGGRTRLVGIGKLLWAREGSILSRGIKAKMVSDEVLHC